MPAEFLSSALLTSAGFSHAFFTRRGGASAAPVDSLHFGSEGHDPQILAKNVALASEALGIDGEHLFAVTQVHGKTAIAVRDLGRRNELLTERGDVVLSALAGATVAVKTADCVPILVADRKSGAAMAVHSGWQGTVQNVVGEGVGALQREIGDRGDLIAAIGPHIASCCFEVGDDVADRLQAACPGTNVILREGTRRPHVDLATIVREQLYAAGLSPHQVDEVHACTKCDQERFFSFRRDGQNSGRLLSAIVAKGAR